MGTAFTVEGAGSVAIVTTNRPEALNALRAKDEGELADLITSLAAKKRVIVLTGSGPKSFCSGSDIKESHGQTAKECLEALTTEARLFDALLQVPVPVIAAVRGYALGLGTVIVCCCDLAVAGASAVFGMPEVRNGVPAGMQSSLLANVVGLGRARWLLYTGTHVDAHTALAYGLVSAVSASDDPLPEAIAAAERLAALPQQGIALQKKIVDSWIRQPFDANVQHNTYVAASAYLDDEPRLAIDRVLNDSAERKHERESPET